MSHSFERQQLYELVWSEPVKNLAARYGVSDVAFSKMCRRNGIPLPPRGYWAKLHAGKRTIKQPLSPRGIGMPEVVTLGRPVYGCRSEPKNLIEMEIPPPPEFSETLSDLTMRVRRLVGKVSVPKNFVKVHRVVGKLLERDEVRRKECLASGYFYSWNAPLFDSPFEKRRLRLLSAIFNALERCGMKPSSRRHNPNDFSVRVGEQHISFMLDHPGQECRDYRPASKSDRPSTDKLCLKIGSWGMPEEIPLVWEDQTDRPIEKQAAQIVVGLIVAGEARYRQQEIFHHQWLIERKAKLIEEARRRSEEEKRLERERRIKADQARIDRLLSEAAALRQANDIRAYVENVRHASSTLSEPVPDDELNTWASWALAQADRIDPVRTRRFLQADEEGCNGVNVDTHHLEAQPEGEKGLPLGIREEEADE